MIGLLLAQRRYEPALGRFDVYADKCVRGAMREYLRRQDPLTREQRKRVRAGKYLDDRDWTAPLWVDPVQMELPGLRERVAQSLQRLNAKQRYVVVRFFYHDIGTRAISYELGVTESRVSQLRREALDKMRNRIIA